MKKTTTIYEQKGVYGDEEKFSNDRLEKMLKLVDSLPYPPNNILDVGCGTGYFSNALLKKYPKANSYGIDISKKAISLGKKQHPRVKFVYGNAEKKLPFKKDFFDLTISGEHIEHVNDVDTYLEEIYRVTKPGGTLIVTTPNLASWMNRILLLLGRQPFYLEASLVKTLPILKIGKYTFPENLKNPPAGHLRLFTLDMIKKLLRSYGFETTNVIGRWILSKPILKQLDQFFAEIPDLSFGYVLKAVKKKEKRSKIIISSYDSLSNPYYGGGGAVAIHEVAKRLNKKFDVTIYTSKYPSSKNEIVDGVTYNRIGLSFLPPKLSQFLFQLLLPYFTLTKSFDLWIESFTPPTSTAFLPLFSRRPVIGVTHFLNAEEKSKEYKLPFTFFQTLGLKNYKYIIALTTTQKEKILRINPKAKVEIIHNATDIVRQGKTIDNPKNYILYMGRLEIAQKGLDILLHSFKKIITKQSLQLYIAGKGHKQDEERLRRLIIVNKLDKSVKLIGHVTGKKKIEVVKNAQCLVVPSRFEGQSLLLIEAIVLGTPIVCFDIEGTRWLEKKLALKAKPFDVEELASNIEKIVTNKKLRKSMSQYGISLKGKFSWETISDQYTKFITEILSV